MLDLDTGRSLPLLLDAALKSVVVSAVVLAALPFLRQAPAATRHLGLLAGLGVLLGLPALMPLLPRQSLPLASLPQLPRAEPLGFNNAAPRLRGQKNSAEKNSAEKNSVEAIAPGITPLPSGVRLSKAQAKAQEFSLVGAVLPPMRPAWLVFGWMLGALACAGRMLLTQLRAWRLTRHCPPLPPSLLSAAGPNAGAFALLKTGPAGTPPLVWGWPRPTLLLPPDAEGWPPARLRAVLRHEAAHVRRRDWLTQTAAQAACALYWFNPIVWLLATRLGSEAERACDDAVLLSGIAPTEYAQDLLAVARSLRASGSEQRASLGTVAMTRRSPVRGRLEAILDTRLPRRRATRRAAAIALIAALAVTAPLAALRPAVRADAPLGTQAAPPAGVPTEADITKVQQHLQSLERDRLVYGWAAAQPNILTPTQITLIDHLIQQREMQRGWERFGPQDESGYQRLQADAKKSHTREERKQIWWAIFAYEHRPASVVKRQHEFNVQFAHLKSKVDALDEYQVVRETRMYGFDRGIALDKTRLERMQMERRLGYPLHMNMDDFADVARWGLESEKDGEMTRADRVHLYLLNAKVMQGHPLTDADLDSALAILRAPSTRPGEAHAYVIAVLLDMRTTLASQQQKIREAVMSLLTSPDKLDQTYSKAVLRRYGESGLTPPASQNAPPAAVPALRQQPARQTTPQTNQQANQRGFRAMIPRRSLRTARVKAAFTALAASLILPATHARPVKQSKPKPSTHTAPTAESAVAPKVAGPATTADAPHWTKLVLSHKPVQALIPSTHWDRDAALPKGVDHLFFLRGDNSLLIHATPAGRAHVQEIVSAIDVAL